ncbi:MAG: tail fiber protein [Bacteroidetes bacterium]|nr:tail fiber protein [Bacteroidota bacterium]
MDETYLLGQIIPYGPYTIPQGWAECNGALLDINKYQSLHSLLGTAFGGDGINTFGLPNLCGLAVVGVGGSQSDLVLKTGQTAGSATVALDYNTTPQHTHPDVVLNAVNAQISIPCDTTRSAAVKKPVDTCPTVSAGPNMYANGTLLPGTVNMVTPVVTATTGGVQAGHNFGGVPHDNMMPYTCIRYIINIQGGDFPRPQ